MECGVPEAGPGSFAVEGEELQGAPLERAGSTVAVPSGACRCSLLPASPRTQLLCISGEHAQCSFAKPLGKLGSQPPGELCSDG